MKKRNLILLPLLVLGSTGLSSLVTSCSKLPESVEFATDEAVVVRVGQPVELPGVTVLPEKAEDKTYSFALSSEGIVTLEEDEGKYILTGVAPGEVVITVTSTANPELKDTILVTVPTPDPLPTPVVKTIAELNAMAKSDYEHLYKVTGVVSSIGKSNSGTHDEYGNMYLSSEDGTDSIMVYGACSDKSCLDWKDYNYTSISFKNKKDMIKSGLSAKIGYGDLITMIVQFQDYNGTKEILGYVIEDSIVKSSTRTNYEASVEVTKVGDLGGASLSKTESIYYGEELTLTVEAVSGYKPVVKLNGSIVNAEEDGTYKAVAGFVNKFTVEYESDSVVYEYTKLEKLTFTCGTDTGVKLNETTDVSSNVVSDLESSNFVKFTGISNIFIGANSGKAPYTWVLRNCIKGGTSKNNGSITFNLKEGLKVGKVVMKVLGWKAGDSISVNEAEAQKLSVLVGADSLEGEELTFTFAGTNLITINTSKRALITEITFYTVEAVEA